MIVSSFRCPSSSFSSALALSSACLSSMPQSFSGWNSCPDFQHSFSALLLYPAVVPSLLLAGGLCLAMLHIDLFFDVLVLHVRFPVFRRPILFALLCLSCPFPHPSSPLVPFLLSCLVLLVDGGLVSLFLPDLSFSFPLVMFSPFSFVSPFRGTLSPLVVLAPVFLRSLFSYAIRPFFSSLSLIMFFPLFLMVLFSLHSPFFDSIGLSSSSWGFRCAAVFCLLPTFKLCSCYPGALCGIF